MEHQESLLCKQRMWYRILDLSHIKSTFSLHFTLDIRVFSWQQTIIIEDITLNTGKS